MSAEPAFADIDVIVSGEYGKLKSTGNLYKTVQKKYSVSYSNWLHHGDNNISDVEAAKKLGIKTKLLMFDGLGQREEYVLSNRETDANFQLAVGISRNLRNFGKAHLGYSCGVFYGGVVLLEYTWNILKKSVEMGFKTLYFIARDGYIPKMIAEYLIDKFNLDIKTRYIYMSITSIIDAFEISENKDIVNDYLKQEINPNEKFAFVDIGGGGGTVNTVGHFLGINEIFTFYLVYNMPNLHRYNGKERIVKMITFSQCPHYFIHESWRLEILFTAPHGRTTGYKREKDKIVPVMLENNIGELYPAYNDYIDGVMDFVYEYAGYIDENPLSDVSYAVINSLMKNDEYSNFFGKMPHEIYEKFSHKLSIVEKLDLSLLNIENTHLPVSPYGTGFRKKLFERFERLRESPLANAYKYIRTLCSKITNRSHNFFTSWNRNLYGKNVVLYGSGAEAQRVHALILINNMCKIVQWVNKEKYIAQIPQKDFDYVLVAMDDVSVVRETANNLVKLGVPKEIIHSSKYGRVL